MGSASIITGWYFSRKFCQWSNVLHKILIKWCSLRAIPKCFSARYCCWNYLILQTGDTFNLEQYIFRQSSHLYSWSCGFMASKEIFIDGIDGAKVVHAFKEDQSLNDLTQFTPSSLNNSLHISQCLFCLCLYATRHDLPSLRVERNGSWSEKKIANLNCLTVRTYRERGICTCEWGFERLI